MASPTAPVAPTTATLNNLLTRFSHNTKPVKNKRAQRIAQVGLQSAVPGRFFPRFSQLTMTIYRLMSYTTQPSPNNRLQMNYGIEKLQSYPFEKLARLTSTVCPPAGKPGINLSVGEPRHPTPKFILDSLQENLKLAAHYPKTRGSDELRTAIARWLVRRFSLPAVALRQKCACFSRPPPNPESTAAHGRRFPRKASRSAILSTSNSRWNNLT